MDGPLLRLLISSRDDRQVMAKAHVAFDKASQKTNCGYLPKCQNFNKPAHPQKKSVDPLPMDGPLLRLLISS
jgi:hypothetical protein